MDPDAQEPRTRALAWLGWALLLSVALHAAALAWLGIVPFRFGAHTSFALTVRLAPSAAEPGLSASAPESRVPAADAAKAELAPAAGSAASRGATATAATLPHRYFTNREVDVPATVLERPPLIYPEDPYIWKLPGTVRLRVYIGEDGRVETAELVSAEPKGHFEQAALDAARAIRYRPAQIGGQPVRSQKLIEVTFDPHENMPGRRTAAGREH